MTKTITYWWCWNCAEEVDPRCVTFQEIHDRCGHPVDSVTDEVPLTDAEYIERRGGTW
jgi:hypothetical protein